MIIERDMPLDNFVDLNWDNLKHNFVDRLVEEWGYSRQSAENSYDRRDGYCLSEYNIWMNDIEPIKSHEIEYEEKVFNYKL
jgi:hypothetical protein